MRTLSFLLTPTRQQVAYRWTETPFEPPRLLIDEARTDAATLRAELETILGEPLRANAYRIVMRPVDYTTLQSAFSDLAIINDAPDTADVFALAEWRTEPPDFAALCDYLSLIDDSDEFEVVRQKVRVVIAGRSARALSEVYKQITGEPIQVPRTPSQGVIERRYRGIPITLLDLRAALKPEVPANMLLIIAAASDPGIGQEELAILTAQSIVTVINTHEDERHFAAMFAYIQQEVGLIPVVSDGFAPDKPFYRNLSIKTQCRVAIESAIRARLLNWLNTLPENDERSRAQIFIEKFSL